MAVNNVNTTSSVGSFGTPRRGVSGLATGMDTDELIKGMTMSTRNKIAKHKQNRQVLTWQGDALRSITDKLNTLSKKYTSFSSSTNLMSQRFFAKTDISTTGANASKVSVTGVGSDQVSIGRIKQMASDETVSTEGVSLGAIVSGEIDFNAEVTQSNIAGKSISIKYGGGTHNITLSEDKDYSTPEKIVESLNELTKDYNISGSTKLSDRVKFELDNSSGEDKIVMSYVQESDGNNVEITGGSSEVLKSLGFSVGDKLTSSEKSITGSEMQDYNTTKTTADLLGGKAITFNLNGIMKTIKLPSAEALKEPEYTVEKLAKSIQASLDTVYGSGRIKVGATLGGSHTLNKLEFTTTDPKKPDGSGGFEKDDTSILKLTGDNGLFGKTGALGMTSGATNRLNLNASIKDAGFPGLDLSNAEVDADGNIKMQINGMDIEGITENTTVKDLMEKINATEGANVKVSYLEMSDKFVISSTVGGASGKVDISDALDSGKDNLASMIFGKEATRTKTAGQDAELTIKYKGTNEEISITRGSNSFSLEGMNVTLKGTFGYTADGEVDAAAEEIGFAASAKTDEVMDTIKNMVKEYNEILEQVNKELTTKRDRKFAPLTDEQREAMSDKEVEKWESKAMAGMLFNNPDLRSLSSEMRFMFGQGASELGISLSSSYSDNGKIVIDEQKLKSALESNPDKVRDFFASPPESGTTGVMHKMKNTLEKYAKTEGVDKGILVNKAGSTFSPLSMTNNALSKQMGSIDKMIASLEGKLKTEEDRYQRQFTSLEQLVSKMNAQSGYLAQQFGG